MLGDSSFMPEVYVGSLECRLVDREIGQSPHAGIEIWSLTKPQPLGVYHGRKNRRREAMARKKIREYDSKRLLKEHLKRLAGIDLQIRSAQVLSSVPNR
ncbi:hypothetical protein GW17_00014458 [Ensete ventricosum]|nr:hypothetical protein GW17_00014458 [Ensete ventricosum]